MPFAKIEEDVSLYYEEKGDGLPIVFIHSFVLEHHVYKYQEPLADSCKLIFYDLRGHGLSSRGSDKLSIRLLAEDLNRLLESLGIDQAVVCGYSNGGLIAQEFALRFPHKTAAIILSGGYSELTTIFPRAFIRASMLGLKFRLPSLVATVQAWMNRKHLEDTKEFYHFFSKADPRRAYEFCEDGLNYTSTEQLHELKMPILLVYGSLEKPMQRYWPIFEEKAPQTKVVYIEKGSHQLPPRKSTEFNAVIKSFLKSENLLV